MIRRRVILASLLLLGMAAAGFWIVLVLAGEDERRLAFEKDLLGKTVDEVKTALKVQPYFFKSREEIQKATSTPLGWPVGEEAVGHWVVGSPRTGEVIVTVLFDADRVAVRVVLYDPNSIGNRLRRFSPL